MLCLNFIFTLNFSELISFLLNTNTSIFLPLLNLSVPLLNLVYYRFLYT